jgi:hypothetical protein
VKSFGILGLRAGVYQWARRAATSKLTVPSAVADNERVTARKRPRPTGGNIARIVGVSAPKPRDDDPTVPPRFARHLGGAARRRRGGERPWVAVARVDGVDDTREQWGDSAAQGFLRSVASAPRASLRESDKVSPVDRAEYGVILDTPSQDDVVVGLERPRSQRGGPGRTRPPLERRDALCGRDAAGHAGRRRDPESRAVERGQRRGGGQVTMLGALG